MNVGSRAGTSGIGGALEACPSCGRTELLPVRDLDDTNFLCAGCGTCWHVEFSAVYRVDPLTCAGCPHREECLARVGDDASG